jgi:outer membrane PBP1 activator LpoA protein
MTQRLIALLIIQWLFIAGLATAAPANNSPNSSSSGVAPVKKTAEANFLDGLACLKHSDTTCAQLALVGIPSQSPYAKLLAGNIATSEGDSDRAFRLLLPLQAEPGLLPQANASLHASLALAYENQPDALRALEQRTLAEDNLSDTADIQANQQHIWQLLSNLSKDELVGMRGESLDTTVQGWIDLALALQDAGQPVRNIANWRKAYPDHPASATVAKQLSEQLGNAAATGVVSSGLKGQVALILPFEVEAFYPAADAIERGFVAAQANAKSDTGVKIYATRGNKDKISAIYQQAISEGAQYVVGPLTRDEVTALAAGTVPVPTLALNQPDSAAIANNLYTFGLSVDAEAAQIVKIARDYGMQTATIVTTPSGVSGHMTKAFDDAWIADGGQIVQQIDLTEKTELADVKAQIVRRPADMILIAGNAEEARAIRPYLDLATPTFGFSHIYAGNAHEPLDRALSAVRFVDLPWLLNQDEPAFASYKAAAADLPPGEMQRWFALGADAYQLLLTLTQQPNKAATIRGLTGKIHVSPSGEITRELALGRFSTDGIVAEKLP